MIVTKAMQSLQHRAPKVAKAASLATATGVIAANSIGGSIPIWLMGATKMITGAKIADQTVIKIANHWIHSNNVLLDKLFPNKDWRISLPDDINPNGKYLLISNHQSWVDTSVIQYVSEKTLPLTRFFTKFELIYIPVVGQTFYFLDFPMMKRHSKEAIAKNPSLKGQDIEEAKRACRLLKDKPFTLLNYLEGTRFTKEKHDKQNSPYQHLLKPRAGGLSLAIQSLGDEIDGILDMTIVYPDGTPSYQDLWLGNVQRLGVEVRKIDMPKALFSAIKTGGYDNDESVKADMFAWLDDIWQQKDGQIETMLAKFDTTQPKAQPQ